MTTDTATPTTVGVRLAGLTKSFTSPQGPVHAVRGIDVSINAGETVALLGPNGAGKSTTIDMLLGLLPPDSGAVSVFGRTPGAAIAEGAIGAMLQTGSLIRDLSVRELLDMMASLYPSPLGVDEVIELAGIGEIAERRTQRLSGGETQRARFAVALVSNPALLVLDEPTVAMDVEARREFWTAMRSYTDTGRTVVFATHYLAEAEDYADRVVLLRSGRVVADGSVSQVRSLAAGRVITAKIPGADQTTLAALPGVTSVLVRGEAAELACADSDTALRALLDRHPLARDVEVRGAGLEAAFVTLTRQEAA
jgi:ABC-2 type transport system ATP-binding protein